MDRMMKSVLLSAAALAAISLAPASAADAPLSPDRCGGFVANAGGAVDRRFVSKRLEEKIAAFGRDSKLLPGMAVAVVKDGKIALLRGYGFEDLGACAPVSVDTRFYLKSTTKTFLGALAAILQDEGKVKLDAPVTEYLPGLSLPAPLNAAQIPLRAHFTHTIPYIDSGLNYATAAFGSIPEEDFVRHVNAHAQERSIEFDYTNFAPIIGAHALGAATGANWRDLIEEKVFAPAGMNSSFTYVAKAEAGPAAVSYLTPARGSFEKTYTKADAQMHAAGGAYSTIADMARWTQIELGDGEVNGASVFPKRVVEQTQARQVQLDWTYYEFRRFAAGLGLYDADYEGEVLSHHFGGETHFSFMPERGIGVVVLTNAIGDGVLVSHRLAALIYDSLLEKPDADERWARRLGELGASFDKSKIAIADYMAKLKARAPKGPPSMDAATLAGVYRNDRLGDVVVGDAGGSLTIRLGVKDGDPVPAGGDSYFVDAGLWGDPPSLFEFKRGAKAGEIFIDWDGRIFTRSAAP
ncbi:MAG: hypothetical protein A3E78_06335 [Alphaproteobacteria bacterium RIFCSPHIGHO2_12_FULL_63_12]|nr:MAG: hypothetical protein A3E78_06335 [Alphaproteobacteria bacterium RIFCSPHIGHO2_12_FULL_63_12]